MLDKKYCKLADLNIICQHRQKKILAEYLDILFVGRKSEEYRRYLGSFGVSGDLALQQIASLSGGQKSRVAFASMCMANPSFLVLDEPTNHLDIESIEALGKAINKYTVRICHNLKISMHHEHEKQASFVQAEIF